LTTAIAKTGGNALDVFNVAKEAPMPVAIKRWLSYIVLLSGTSNAVKDELAVIRQFQVGKEAFLPKEIPVLVLATRPHASYRDGKNTIAESFDINEPEFAVVAAAEIDPAVKASNTANAAVGHDFLLYIPALNEFAYFFLKKTALDNINEFTKALQSRQPQILKSSKRENPDFSWFVPRLTEEPGLEIDMSVITPEAAAHAMDLFSNPKPQGREEKSTAKKGGRKGRK
jgi:hypothetical protein